MAQCHSKLAYLFAFKLACRALTDVLGDKLGLASGQLARHVLIQEVPYVVTVHA
jgi:hypothetical protein